MNSNGELAIFSGSHNDYLKESLQTNLVQMTGGELDLSPIAITKFSDGEVFVKLGTSTRGKDVFIIQSLTSAESIWELFLIIDACRRASAKRITAVIPYFAYARQDRKSEPRVPISAKVMAKHLEASGIDRAISIELHANQIQGFFDIPLDHLYTSKIMIDYIKGKELDNITIVSPDAGGMDRARYYANKLNNNTGIAVIDKRRSKANQSEVMNVLGDIEGQNCVIVDDMIDTGGTICKAAGVLMDKGAVSVRCVATHGVLSGEAINNLSKSVLDEVIITDTYPYEFMDHGLLMQKEDHIQEFYKSKFKIISIGKLLSKAIYRIHNETSLAELFL